MKKIVLLLIFLTIEVSLYAEDQSWVPPIGIPAPSFGINETYRMYDDESNQNPALTYYESPSGGKYTHYVDSTSPNATTNGVPSGYGSPEYPRTSLPTSLPAGSVVEIHNDALPNSEGHILVGGEGTEQYPIFIRGVDKPNIDLRLSVGWIANSSYIIVEGVKINRGSMAARKSDTTFDTNHICYRNCEIASYDDGYGGFNITGDTKSSNQAYHLVLYNCSIHDNGDYDYVGSGDPDVGGVSIKDNCSYIWILDCQMYRNGYNAVQVGGATTVDMSNNPDHVYVGGNVSYNNRQVGFAIKTAYDVVFSQNISYDPMSEATACYLLQYDPKRVWFLFNTAYGHTKGFRTGSGYSGTPEFQREENYWIGNLIYDCSVAGMEFDGHEPSDASPVILNTIYNCPIGIYNGYYNAKINAYNNIISNYTTAVDFLNEYASNTLSNFDYNLIDGSGNIKWNDTYSNLVAFRVGTDQGDNCVEDDPLFVDSSMHNFNLQESSPINNMETSDKVGITFERFQALYGIDLAADIDGIPRVGGIVIPDDSEEEEDSSNPAPEEPADENPDTPAEVPADSGENTDTGTSDTSETVSPIISPLPMSEDTEIVNSYGDYSSLANFSTISTLASTSDAGLHITEGKTAKIRGIKVRGIFNRFDDIYCPPKRNPKYFEDFE